MKYFEQVPCPELEYELEYADTNKPGRHYQTPDGRAFPSVTTVLGATSDKTFLEEWRKRIGEEEANRISKAATDIGSDMHLLCEHYLKNEAVPEIKNKKAITLFSAMRPKLEANVDAVIKLEAPLYSNLFRIAGRTDGIVYWRGELAIIDFKSNHKTDRLKKEEDIKDYFLQIAIYTLMFEERTNLTVNKGAIIISNGLVAQVFEFNPQDYKAEAIKRIRQYYEQSSTLHPVALR